MESIDLWKTPVALGGKFVRLEPMTEAHIPALAVAGKDEDIWKYMLYGNLGIEANMRAWVQDMLGRQAKGTDLNFVVFHLERGVLAGATRYLDMQPAHRALEIGGTWYAPEFQRTAVNTECKFLLLQYAFEQMKCIRVQFKADARNERSLRAIERLGANREGVLRNHMILPDGTVRDSVYYSILDREWPVVKTNLAAKLAP